MDLFRYRFSDLRAKYKTEFLHRNSLHYDTVRAFSVTQEYAIYATVLSLNLVQFEWSNSFDLYWFDTDCIFTEKNKWIQT